jgi:hypothetical protein
VGRRHCLSLCARTATTALGLQLNVVDIGAQANVDTVYATLAEKHTDAVVVSADGMFWGLRDQLITSAAQHSLPTMYFAREFVAAGGLVSYNSDYADSIRKTGTYPAEMKTSACTVVEARKKRPLNLASVEIFDRPIEARAGGVPATQRAPQLFGQPTGNRPGVLVRA